MDQDWQVTSLARLFITVVAAVVVLMAVKSDQINGDQEPLVVLAVVVMEVITLGQIHQRECGLTNGFNQLQELLTPAVVAVVDGGVVRKLLHKVADQVLLLCKYRTHLV